MLSEFLEELDKLQDRIAAIYNEIDIVNRCTNLSPSSFIQNEGKMKGMQDVELGRYKDILEKNSVGE